MGGTESSPHQFQTCPSSISRHARVFLYDNVFKYCIIQLLHPFLLRQCYRFGHVTAICNQQHSPCARTVGQRSDDAILWEERSPLLALSSALQNCTGVLCICLVSNHLQGMKAATKKQKYEKISEKKMATPVEFLCKGFPLEFTTYFQYCRSLRFDDKPDYSYLRKIFRDLFVRQGGSCVTHRCQYIERCRDCQQEILSPIQTAQSIEKQQGDVEVVVK